MDIRDKLASGHYGPAFEYPSKPSQPAVLRKRASDLTAEEISALMEVREAHEAQVSAYERDRAEYRRQEDEGIQRFRDDLERAHGTAGHPKADLLWGKAWEMGHSAGLDEVMIYYEDLAELVV